MKYFEFGKENEELMVLLHGGGTSYLGVLPTAKKIAEKYHVILLAYDGFNIRSQLLKLFVIFPAVSALAAWICTRF